MYKELLSIGLILSVLSPIYSIDYTTGYCEVTTPGLITFFNDDLVTPDVVGSSSIVTNQWDFYYNTTLLPSAPITSHLKLILLPTQVTSLLPQQVPTFSMADPTTVSVFLLMALLFSSIILLTLAVMLFPPVLFLLLVFNTPLLFTTTKVLTSLN